MNLSYVRVSLTQVVVLIAGHQSSSNITHGKQHPSVDPCVAVRRDELLQCRFALLVVRGARQRTA